MLIECAPEISQLSLEHTVQSQISPQARFQFSAEASTRNGIGEGGLNVQYSRRDGKHESSVR